MPDFSLNVFVEKDRRVHDVEPCDDLTTFLEVLCAIFPDLDEPELLKQMRVFMVPDSIHWFAAPSLQQDIVNLGPLQRLKEVRIDQRIGDEFNTGLMNDETVHIIVRGGGPLTLNVFLTKSKVTRSVDIPLTARMKDLKIYLEDVQIHAVYKPRQSIATSNARDVVAMLGSLSHSCDRVRDATLVSDLFPGVFSTGDIQLLVEEPGVHEESLDQLPHMKTFRYQIHCKAQTHSQLPSEVPSSEGMPATFEKRQGYELTRVYCGRPLITHKAIPAVLLNPVLCQFAYNLHSCEPDVQDIECYNELLDSQSDFFPSEFERTEAFTKTLKMHQIVNLEATTVPNTITGVDGGLTIKDVGGSGIFLVVNLKGRIEMGATGAEPLLENIQYWLQFVDQYLKGAPRDKCLTTNFPVLLILLMGPYLGVAVGAFQSEGDPSVQILHPIIPLFSHPTDEETGTAGERMICAIRKATIGLSNHYTEIQHPNHPVCQPEFPFPSTFQVNNQVIKFKYDCIVNSTQHIFRAHQHDDPGQKYCIKFTRRYGDDAHWFATSGSFAPDLYAVEEFYGWKMIVMHDISKEYHGLHSSRPEDREEVRRLLLESLKKLHGAGFVHGDICDVNIMWRIHEGQIILKLIDFDSAGRIGQARYPHRINRRDIIHPNGVIPGGLIHPEHDLDMAKWVLAS